MMDRFLVVDDHPLFREALQSAVRTAYPQAEVVEASSIEEAVAQVERRPGFDLALIDLSMPSVKGFEGVLSIRARFPGLPLVVVSGLEDPRIVAEAMNCGVSGFIPKSIKKAELTDAIRKVMNGEVFVPASYAPAPAADKSKKASKQEFSERLATLTPQQLRVLGMLRQGLLNKQIAYELDVGETTVKAHVSEILRKLNVASRTQAVIEASGLDFDAILKTGGKGAA
ncbi:MAG: response regulator transcription factor [Hyphomicrobiales bacterium]|nr:response regulator transcription factor [Hyphomicrobiales bacterium]